MVPKIMKQGRLTPLIYLGPALIIMLIFIVYPTFSTIYLSFFNANSTASAAKECVAGQPCWGVFENYRYALTNPDMLIALRNNALWLLLMVPATVAVGLLFAELADKVKYEGVAKSIIFLPMAISFIGAGIIWRFVYYVNAGGGPQIGLLDAILVKLGLPPVAWLSDAKVNNFCLMVVGVWLWAGFCMTILSAAIKGLPDEVIEAARVDGAGEWHLFRTIIFPMILPTVIIVTTTMVINILKIFDVVFVMTNGLFGTQVIANAMFQLIVSDVGKSMAIAVVLIILTIPVMIFNVRRIRAEEAAR
jgi:alpha-glucoside transport system permease protein